jgi:hypothetical protein
MANTTANDTATPASETKHEQMSDFQDFEPSDAGNEKQHRTVLVVQSVRFALTLLALLAGITILATTADTISVYNMTRLGADFFISLWPAKFDIRPTIAFIVCSSIIFLASTISLVVMKVPAVSFHCLTFHHIDNDIPNADPKYSPHPHHSLLRRPHHLPHRCAHRHVLLLRRQRFDHAEFP